MIFDEGDICWEDEDSKTIDQALAKAEKYLKEVEFPERFDDETIEEIENS